MPQHRTIRFKEPRLPEKIQQQIIEFTDRHPFAVSGMQVLLATIAVGGILTLSVAAPGFITAFGKYKAKRKQEQRARYQQVWANFYRLKKEHSLVYKGNTNEEMVYELSNKGQKRLRKFLLDTLEIASPKRWNGKWHIILFDIPVGKRKSIRNSFREKLRNLGCYQYQRSVWVHPFPCEAEIGFLKEYYGLGPHVAVWNTKEMPSGRVLYHFKDALKDCA